MGENIVLDKSFKFALRIVRLYKYLTEEKKEFVLSRNLLTSGTEIGAYIKEAQDAESKPIFYQEMGIALRKSSRTEYWLQLLRDGGFLDAKEFDSIDTDRLELKKLLVSITKTSKRL